MVALDGAGRASPIESASLCPKGRRAAISMCVVGFVPRLKAADLNEAVRGRGFKSRPRSPLREPSLGRLASFRRISERRRRGPSAGLSRAASGATLGL
jgi:hypothetical protein